MKARWFALAAFGAALIASGPASAGACDPVRPGNNPAFGEPRSCSSATVRPMTPTATTAPAKPRAVEVRRENGRTVYTSGDTTITIGGYVAADFVGGRSRR